MESSYMIGSMAGWYLSSK